MSRAPSPDRVPSPAFLTLALITILTAAAAWAQEPADVVVEVGAEPLGPVPALATAGFNYGNGMRVVGHEDAFGRLRVDTLRYPPGNQADEMEIAAADLDALAMNLDLLGRPPVLMVANLFGGSPEDAAALARLVDEKDIPVLAWEIGNEPDLYATNRNDPSWTPDRWCNRFRAFAGALRDVDPDARVAGPAVSGSRPGGEAFLREALRLCGDVIDVLTWHVYPTDGTRDDADALATASTFGDELARYRTWAADPEANPLGHDRAISFGVTEFGLSWRSSSYRHLEDDTAALWLADVLGQMTHGRLDVSHYFTLQGMGGHGLIGTGGWIRPTYHVYEMLSSFTGEALPVRTDPPLRAYAVRHAGATEVLLVNRGTTALRADVRIAGHAASELETRTLASGAADADPPAGSDADAAWIGAPAPERGVVPAGAPVPVPPRAVVHLRAPAANP